MEFLLLQTLNLFLILPNVILPVCPPRISLTRFRTRIIGNTVVNKSDLKPTSWCNKREERRIQGFGGETYGKETTWETQA
jgi:hypothetical protein